MPVTIAIEKTKYILQSSVLLAKDKDLIKVLIAVNSSKDKTMLSDDVQRLTGLDLGKMNEFLNFLEKAGYVNTIMDDIPGGSPHKICTLTEEGEKLLKSLNIE